ncbi:MAG: hypothetical protein AB7F43_09465 [Bacteriovoracia bacterium]
MLAKFSRSLNRSLLPITFNILLFGSAAVAHAGDFQFFDSGIDYWGDNKKEQKPAPQPEPPKVQAEVPQNEGAFDWKKYMDPKNKDFFKEGEYTPPEPFMELVRNPSDQNIKMWFAYMEKKNQLADQLQTRVREYTAKNGQVTLQGAAVLSQRLATLPRTDTDYKRYRFRIYFDSHCPHCHEMFKTMADLGNRGFFVEGRQTDGDTKGLGDVPFQFQRATKEELAEKGIQSVPVLLIGDMKKKVLYRMSGYQTTEAVLDLIAKQEGK